METLLDATFGIESFISTLITQDCCKTDTKNTQPSHPATQKDKTWPWKNFVGQYQKIVTKLDCKKQQESNFDVDTFLDYLNTIQ